MPTLPSSSSTGNSIQIGTNSGVLLSDDAEEAALAALGGKWEDEEERRFFEDIQDLREIVPKSILGIEDNKDAKGFDDNDAEAKKNAEEGEVRRLEEELAGLEASDGAPLINGKGDSQEEVVEEEDDG
jgi:regulator of nonsense transcripts 2